MPERTDLAGGSLNGSDRLVVELVEPPDTPPFIPNWPPEPTVCAQAQFDQIVAAAMRLLSSAVVALAAIRSTGGCERATDRTHV
jgi:hypothetical protein